jgi:hypothetical protein
MPDPGQSRRTSGRERAKEAWRTRRTEAITEKVRRAQRWAVTMTKVRIRHAMSRAPFPRWHFVSFTGRGGNEASGIVDLVAIRKDFKKYEGFERGDRFQIILIQVKGGQSAKPTTEDADRMRAVARYHRAQCALLASWKKGTSARFFSLRAEGSSRHPDWVQVSDLKQVFGHVLKLQEGSSCGRA